MYVQIKGLSEYKNLVNLFLHHPVFNQFNSMDPYWGSESRFNQNTNYFTNSVKLIRTQSGEEYFQYDKYKITVKKYERGHENYYYAIVNIKEYC